MLTSEADEFAIKKQKKKLNWRHNTTQSNDLIKETSWPVYTIKLEGTHRVRTHAVLLLILTLTLTFDLSTQNHVTCRIS